MYSILCFYLLGQSKRSSRMNLKSIRILAMLKSSGMVSIPMMDTASLVFGMISLTMFINTVRDSNMVTPNICILVRE